MRKLWTIISVLAVVNLIAIGGVLAWLSTTGRLNGERIHKVREMLREPIPAEKARLDADAAKAAEAVKADEKKARQAGLPETAAGQLDRQRDAADIRQQTILRLREEVEQLRATLARQEEQLAGDKQALADAEKRLADREAQLARNTGAANFQAALASLESQKPQAARLVLQALIDGGKRDEAVAYLAAMQDRVRGKVLAEFIKTDEKLAAGLLEQLRLRGIDAPPPRTAAP